MHDVFISHSSRDKAVADAICSNLENRGIRCWIAPRDIVPGADWGESILRAMSGAQVMVLVLSQNANSSPQIKREVERAVNRGVVIIPVRIEEVLPASSLEYFLSTAHWLDAFPPPTDQYFGVLATTVEQILAHKSGWHRSPGSVIKPQSPSITPAAAPATTPPWWEVHRLKLILLIILFLLVLVTVGLGTYLILNSRSSQEPKVTTTTPTVAPTPDTESKNLVGIWRETLSPNSSNSSGKIRGLKYNSVVLAAITAATASTTLGLRDSGEFQLKTLADDTGQFQVAGLIITFIPGRGFTPLQTKLVSLPSHFFPDLMFNGLDNLGESVWNPASPGKEGINQLWSAYHLDFLQHDGLWFEGYRAQLDLSDGHSYRLKLNSNINGKYEFKNGHFRMLESSLTTQNGVWEGTYILQPLSTLQLTDPDGTSTWTKQPD